MRRACERDAAHSENNINANNVTQVVNRNRKCGEMAGAKVLFGDGIYGFSTVVTMCLCAMPSNCLNRVAIMCDGGLSVFKNEKLLSFAETNPYPSQC